MFKQMEKCNLDNSMVLNESEFKFYLYVISSTHLSGHISCDFLTLTELVEGPLLPSCVQCSARQYIV